MTNNVPVAGSFTLIGHDASGAPTTINGRQSVSFTNVNAINASLGNGNDHLTLGFKKLDGSLTPFNLDSNLSVDMGDGNNTVDLLATTTIRGEASITSGDLADNFNISGNFQRSLSINANGGLDFVQVNKATVTNDLNINAGTDDHFDWVNVYNTKVGRDVKIDMGDGPRTGDFVDHMQIDNLIVNHDLTLLGGAGKHEYSITNSKIKDALFATLGGDDSIGIANTTVSNKTDLHMGGGTKVRITDSNFGNRLIMDVGSSHYDFQAAPNQTLFIHSFSAGN
jgi:hypothetical protein